MAVPRQLLHAVRGALAEVPGLRLATPEATPGAGLPLNVDGLAVTATGEEVELRVVALELPVLPLLHKADVALRSALAGTAWATTALRLVVTDLDAAALSGQKSTHHSIGP